MRLAVLLALPLPAILISNMKNIQESTAEIISRGTLPKVRYEIAKIKDAYVWQRSEGGDIPVGHLTEIKEFFVESADGTKIDLTNNIKEIRVNYGN